MKRRALTLAATIALATVIYGVRLGEPTWGNDRTPHYVFDEKYTAFTAHRLLAGDPSEFKVAARRYEYAAVDRSDLTLTSRSEWSHPPGAPLALAPFIAAFGYTAVDARAASLCAAIAALIATSVVAGRRAAWCACALLACDGAFFVFARTAMPQMFLVAALTSGAALVMRAITARGRAQLGWSAGAGFVFGYAVSVRWTGGPIALAIVIAAAASRGANRQRLGMCALLMAGAAGATYVATFAPFLWRGHGVGELIDLHRAMLWFHTHLPKTRAQSSPWYAWPWELRPVELAHRLAADAKSSIVVWCAGGRLLWWALVPSWLWGAWRARKRAASDLVPVAAIAATWLPWAIFSRYGYAYDLLPALPFAATLIARPLVAARLRALAPAYVGTALALFAATYPVLAGVPMSEETLGTYRAAFGVPPPRSAPSTQAPPAEESGRDP